MELPHWSAMWWQHSRSAGVIVEPGRTHAMTGVIAHNKAIVNSANARVLVTLISVRFLRIANKLLRTTIFRPPYGMIAVTAITVPKVVTRTRVPREFQRFNRLDVMTCLGHGAMTEARSAVVATLSAALKAAMNRRSVDTASTFASAKLRSTIPRRSLISRGLVGSRFSQPYSIHPIDKKLLVAPRFCDHLRKHSLAQPGRKRLLCVLQQFCHRFFMSAARSARLFLRILVNRKNWRGLYRFVDFQQTDLICWSRQR